MDKNLYLELVDHYERCFEKFGATPKGVDWPNEHDLNVRFQVMLDICHHALKKTEPVSILDLGCGYGALYDFILKNDLANKIQYHGVDLSEKMIISAKNRHPSIQFEVRDILIDRLDPAQFDFVLMNGLLTERTTLSQHDMEEFSHTIIKEAYELSKNGIAYNVMSDHVDWKREDLFYVSFDRMADFLKQQCSKHYTFRSDYGLYEYIVYVYKQKK